MKKHAEISTYFCLKHRCGKKSAIFPYSVSEQKPRDYPPWCVDHVVLHALRRKMHSGLFFLFVSDISIAIYAGISTNLRHTDSVLFKG